MDLLALASLTHRLTVSAPPTAAESGGLVINVFWILVVAANFLIFLVAAWYLGLRNRAQNLATRRDRIEQSLRDADAARVERQRAASERVEVLAQARQEAEVIVVRAQSVANDSLEREHRRGKSQIEQMKARAAADIATERERAVAEVRAEVAELALLAAARVVGETMNEPRERRLVDEFLAQVGRGGSAGQAQAGSTAAPKAS